MIFSSKIPVLTFGIPLKNINNPFLIIMTKDVYTVKVEIKKNRDSCEGIYNNFLEMVKESLGINVSFYCSKVEPYLPVNSLHVFLSEAIKRLLIKEFEGVVTEEELNDIYNLIDSSMDETGVINSLRSSSLLSSSILARKGEKPVKLFNVYISLRSLLINSELKMRESLIDSSLIHFIGFLPLKAFKALEEGKLSLEDLNVAENSLWSMVYSAPQAPIGKWFYNDNSSVSLFIYKFHKAIPSSLS